MIAVQFDKINQLQNVNQYRSKKITFRGSSQSYNKSKEADKTVLMASGLAITAALGIFLARKPIKKFLGFGENVLKKVTTGPAQNIENNIKLNNSDSKITNIEQKQLLEGSLKHLINNYLDELKTTLDKLDRQEIENFIKILINARDNNKTIFVMGNGGSASTASHFVCDFSKGLSYGKDNRFKMISLNDNLPIMTAYANDISYENIFLEQLKNLFQKGDVVIGISGSGNSKNVLNAIKYANENGGVTIGITGYNGGELKQITNHSVNTNIPDMQITEDIHMILDHLTNRVINLIEK